VQKQQQEQEQKNSNSLANSPAAMSIHSEGAAISFNLQGSVWVAALPEGNWSKATIKQVGKDKRRDKEGQKEGSRHESRNDGMEIVPKWRHASLSNQILTLKATSGTEETVSLEGCEVLAISTSPGPSRKWGKRAPIKVHHPDQVLFNGCKDLLIFFETGWEKEAWCQVLRATAGASTSTIHRTRRDYQAYTHQVEAHMPYVNKFFTGLETKNQFSNVHKSHKSPNVVAGVSRRRTIWRKLTSRTFKPSNSQGNDYGTIQEQEGEIDSIDDAGSTATGTDDTQPNNASIADHDKIMITNQKDEDEEPKTLSAEPKLTTIKEIQQGLICLNMVVSRLYFDFHKSPARMASIQRFFQRQLLKLRTPNYIKSVTVKEFGLGDLPPIATGIRMLPADSEGTLAFEVDVEWHTNFFITCETGLEVRDAKAQESVTAQATQPGLAGAAAAALLTGIEEDLESNGTGQEFASQNGFLAGPKAIGAGEGSNRRGKWVQSMKSMMSHVADQVSQVPLLLRIYCTLLKGTMVVKMKAPPTNHVWFSFKEMPEMDLVSEPCIGDHRISSGPLAAFVVQQLKTQLQDTLVMPNCEDLFMNWMMSETDDWLPQSTVPVAFTPGQAYDEEQQSSKWNPGSQIKAPNNYKPEAAEGPAAISNINQPHHTSSIPSSSSQASNLENPDLQFDPVPASYVRQDLQTDLTSPLLDKVDYHQGGSAAQGVPSMRGDYIGSEYMKEDLSGRDLEGGVSDRTLDSVVMDILQQSEGSASDNEVPNLVSFAESHDNIQEAQPNLQSRRSKMLFLGKKMGVKLDEKRRTVLEKLRERKADSDGSSHWGGG